MLPGCRLGGPIDLRAQGQAALLNYNSTTQGYSLNSSTAGASRGSTILIYATGLEDFQKQPSGAAMTDGQVAPAVALGVTDQTAAWISAGSQLS